MFRKIPRSRIEKIAVCACITTFLLILLAVFFLAETSRWFNESSTRLILVKKDNSPIYYEDGNQVYQGLLHVHPAARFNVLSMQKYRCTTQFYSEKHDYYDDQDIYLCFFKRNYGGYTKKYIAEHAFRVEYPALGEEGSSRLPNRNFVDVNDLVYSYPDESDPNLYVFLGKEYNTFFDKAANFVLPGDPDYKYPPPEGYEDDEAIRQHSSALTYYLIEETTSLDMVTFYLGGELLNPYSPRYLYSYNKDAAIGYLNETTAEKLYRRLFEIDEEMGMRYDYIVIELTYRNVFELNNVKKWAKRWGYEVKKTINW